jgi:hypothetical protein
MKKRMLKVAKKPSPIGSSKLQLYLILTTVIPGIILILSYLGILSADFVSEVWGGFGLWVGYGLVFIVILAEARHATGSKRYLWRYYVLPLIIPALVASAIYVGDAIQSHNEQVLEQTPGYKLAMAYSDQCNAISDFSDTDIAGDTRLNIIMKTGIDPDALKQRIFDMDDYIMSSELPSGDCGTDDMSEAAAKHVDEMYPKVEQLNMDMGKFDAAYKAALAATYGNDPSVYPDNDDPSTGVYSWPM